jgi:general secretion pathway protein B
MEKETKKNALSSPAKPPVTERTSTGHKPGQEKGPTPLTEKIFSLSELPPAVRNALPEFRISGHAYSPDRQNRVARVNDKILQEGQELTPGLKVEEIVPDGIIFNYQSYRFRVGTNENR